MGYSPASSIHVALAHCTAYFAVHLIKNLVFCFLAIVVVRIAISKRSKKANISVHTNPCLSVLHINPSK